ncbi:MAG: ABC transporter permease [Rubrivivax sp.]
MRHLLAGLGRRLIREVPGVAAMLLIISMISFALVALLPGDLATLMLGETATAEAVTDLQRELGTQRPLHERYGQWLLAALQGDVGRLHHTGLSVADAMAERIPVTLELMALTLVLSVVIAVPLGVLTGFRPGRTVDRVLMNTSLTFLSAPAFLIGIVLVYLFAIHLEWLPATGWVPLAEDLGANLRSLALPVAALVLHDVPIYMRVLRREITHVLQQDYILLARAAGLSRRTILWRSALRPASVNLITAVGLGVGRLLGGAMTVEVLFGLPGLGQLLVEAVFRHEYALMQGIVLFIAAGYVAINLVVDLLCAALDPRLRDGELE